jgi:hypothetical protein
VVTQSHVTESNPGGVTQGDRFKILQLARERLVAALQKSDTSSRELPALSRELRQVLAELESLGGKAEVSRVDQLAARRARLAQVAAAERASST